MDFERAQEYLAGFISYEKKSFPEYNEENFGLQRVRDFLAAFGVDYSAIKFVHVAGSKGKGSICTMTAQYLWKISKSAGLYTSPDILGVRERFQVNGEQISEDLFTEYVVKLQEFIELEGDFGLTYFELLTVLALKYFVDFGVEYAVMEVGLGGRLDATNVVFPELTVLSSVELEHVGVLGDTLDEILGEKLGIVKEGVPLVVGGQSSELMELLKKRLEGRDLLYYVDDYKTSVVVHKVLELLLGVVDEDVFSDLVANFKLVGRFDVRKVDGKLVVFDMAHTPLSIKLLCDYLHDNFKKKEFVVLLSVLRDKQVLEIGNLLSKISSKIVFTVANEERGIAKPEFDCLFFEGEINFQADCMEAFSGLLEVLKKDQVLLVTGSHFLVAKILSSLKLG